MSLIEVVGFNGGTLYYEPDAKHFYVKEKDHNGNTYMICHDQMEYKNERRKSEKNRSKKDLKPCPARCSFNHITGEMKLTAEHAHEDNHEVMYKDLMSLDSMKDKCRFLAEHFPFSAHKVSVREIYLMEMAK